MALYKMRLLYETMDGLSYKQIKKIEAKREDDSIIQQGVLEFLDKTHLKGNPLPKRQFSKMNQLYIVDDVTVFQNVSLKFGSCAEYMETHRKLKKMQVFAKSSSIKMKWFCNRPESSKQYLVIGLSKPSAKILAERRKEEDQDEDEDEDEDEEDEDEGEETLQINQNRKRLRDF